MKAGRRRKSLRLLALVFLLSSPSIHVGADPQLSQQQQAGLSESLKNKDGKTACELQNWMSGPDCTPGGGGSRDGGEGDQNPRRTLHAREDDDFLPTRCTCTLPYFNIRCGCQLSTGGSPENYTQWREACAEANLPITQDIEWLNGLKQDIPLWSYIATNNGSFFMGKVTTAALMPNTWTRVQIITPVVVGTCTFILVAVFFVYWHHYRHQQARTKGRPTFRAFVRKVFTPSTRSIHHEDRDNDWKIDPGDEHAVDDNDDQESFFMVPTANSLVESPVEVSHWSPSPTNESAVSSPGRSRYSFTPRQPSRLREERIPYKQTIRSIGDRVREMMPWASHPTPVTNIRPEGRYRIDGDQTPRQGSRSLTASTLSTRRGTRRYETISEMDDEGPDTVPTGRTRSARHMDTQRSIITDEDRAAVADSVIVIGDRDFTLESGSTGQHGTPSGQTPITGGFRNFKSPSDRLDFQVEPPSPTLESATMSPRVIPPSPGAPPLLPPPPQERPPLPPVTTRDTPRRTPSPHLRVDTRIDDTSSYHSRKLSDDNSNSSNIHMNAEPYMHPALRPSNSDLQRKQAQQPQSQHHRDLSGSDSNTNALSYASVHPNAHQHSRSTSNNTNENTSGYLAVERNSSPTSQRRSGSGSRPLPPQPTGGRAPSPHPPSGRTHSPPQLSHQKSETSMGQFSILRTPDAAVTDKRRLSFGGETTQSEFDPYIASGVPRPIILQPVRRQDAPNNQHPPNPNPFYGMHQHQRSVSSTSLPRTPGEALGQHHRGWSADDDAEPSLLIGRAPMEVDDGFMGGGGRNVYLAEPRNVNADGHFGHLSRDSLMTDYGNPESVSGGGGTGGEDESPPLSALEADPQTRSGFARYAGRESISGSSGWDASTQYTHGTNISPIDPPPRAASRTPNPNPRHNAPFDPGLTPNRNLSPNLSPRLGGHARLESGGAGDGQMLKNSRSRENLLAPARNDPLNLFPASVRAAGYTTGLEPDAIPVPSPSPRPTGNNDGNGHVVAGGGGSGNGGAGVADLTGYVERNRAQASRGGTWNTESSGVQSVLEPVQQLPHVYTPPHGPSAFSKRTP